MARATKGPAGSKHKTAASSGAAKTPKRKTAANSKAATIPKRKTGTRTRSPDRVDGATPTGARTTIAVQGARVHNLKNISVEIPRDRLVVMTGMSGSGKSSLAFDTIYAEGQRRYMESLSTYAKRFIAQVEKPDVDFLHGLSPVISIG